MKPVYVLSCAGLCVCVGANELAIIAAAIVTAAIVAIVWLWAHRPQPAPVAVAEPETDAQRILHAMEGGTKATMTPYQSGTTDEML